MQVRSEGADLGDLSHEIVMTSADMRASLFILEPGQTIPWHYHTEIEDQFYCLEGPMTVEMGHPPTIHVLTAGDHLSVPRGTPHFIYGDENRGSRFLLLQGVGVYDNFPLASSLGAPATDILSDKKG